MPSSRRWHPVSAGLERKVGGAPRGQRAVFLAAVCFSVVGSTWLVMVLAIRLESPLAAPLVSREVLPVYLVALALLEVIAVGVYLFGVYPSSRHALEVKARTLKGVILVAFLVHAGAWTLFFFFFFSRGAFVSHIRWLTFLLILGGIATGFGAMVAPGMLPSFGHLLTARGRSEWRHLFVLAFIALSVMRNLAGLWLVVRGGSERDHFLPVSMVSALAACLLAWLCHRAWRSR